MNLLKARQKLYDQTFVLGRMRQKAALKYLAETAEIKAMDVLVAALKKYKNPKEVESVLVKVVNSAKIDRLWQLWSDGRSVPLLDVLIINGKEPSNEQLKILYLLKHNRENELPIDRKTLRSVLKFIEDRDEDMKKASIRYIQQVAVSKDSGTEGFYAKLLALSFFGHELKLPIERKTLVSAMAIARDSDAEIKNAAIHYIERVAAIGVTDEEMLELKLLSLLKLGREPKLPLNLKILRAAMGFVTDPDEDVMKAVARFAKRFPISEEFNDELFAAWIKTTSKYLKHVIQTQNRKPRSPSTEALFYLATGQAQRYQAMKDNDGGLFLEAWIMAPDVLRQVINDTVSGSGDWQLAEAYKNALMSREDFNLEVHVKALKTAKNDEKLFEAARYMRLSELLDLCEYWTSNQWQPKDTRVQKIVTLAIKAYRKLGAIFIKPAEPCPVGTVDIFDLWKSREPHDGKLKEGLTSENPFIRAKSLYLGHSKGLVSETDISSAVSSDHWPDRLVARMHSFHLAVKAGPDRVEWISACMGIDGDMLSARVECTPDEYESFKSQYTHMTHMIQSKASAPDRSLYLLIILQLFQRYFISGKIEVTEDDSTEELWAIVVSDATDLSF